MKIPISPAGAGPYKIAWISTYPTVQIRRTTSDRATKAAFLRGAWKDIKGDKAKGFALFLLSAAENSELVDIEWFKPNPRRREELRALCLDRFERMEDVFHWL